MIVVPGWHLVTLVVFGEVPLVSRQHIRPGFAELEQQLAVAREAFAAQREAMESHFKHNFGSAPAALGSSGMEESSGKGKEKSLPKRDDDTHYFNSYSHNGQCQPSAQLPS